MLWLIENVDSLRESDVLPTLARISPEHAERLSALRVPPARIQGALARLLLCFALRKEYGLPALPDIRAGEHGKPFFPTCPEISFNLSHCKTAVACAMDAAPLGVDVQGYRPLTKASPSPASSSKSSPLGAELSGGQFRISFSGCASCARGTGNLSVAAPVRTLAVGGVTSTSKTEESEPSEAAEKLYTPPIFRVLSDSERSWVCAPSDPASRDRRFIQIWTCKEAYGKALGVGLGCDFRHTSFQPSPEPWTQSGFTFTQWVLPTCALTLCAEKTLPLRRVSFEELITCFNGGN